MCPEEDILLGWCMEVDPRTIRINVTERTNVTLNCSADVGGSEVPTWSRESAGKRQQIRHVSAEDKTLTLTDVKLGDSGLYYCDGKPAAYLNVTKGETQDSRGQ
ncbi:hypothetical protein Q8A73_000112 [Channa argus]|nr:hypothetical protein Q8A73_000112 [Channa argus]